MPEHHEFVDPTLAPYRDPYPTTEQPAVYQPTPISPIDDVVYRRQVEELLLREQLLLAHRAAQAGNGQPVVYPGYPGLPATFLPRPAVEPVSARAKTYALVSVSTGGAVALGGIGLAQAAPALAVVGQAAAGLGTFGAVALAGWLLLRGTRSRTGQGEGGTEVHIHRGAKVRIRNLHNHNG